MEIKSRRYNGSKIHDTITWTTDELLDLLFVSTGKEVYLKIKKAKQFPLFDEKKKTLSLFLKENTLGKKELKELNE